MYRYVYIYLYMYAHILSEPVEGSEDPRQVCVYVNIWICIFIGVYVYV